MRILALLACLALAGCATTRPDANYTAYIEANARAEQNRAIAEQALSDASACNGDPACVISVKAIAGLTMQGGAASRQPVRQHVRQPGAFENVTLGALRAAERISMPYFGWRSHEASTNASVAMAGINADREVGMAEAWAGVTTAVANREPTYSYDIGGDYVSGHVGDTVGGDQISGQQHIGDWRTGDDIRRDTIGRDRTDYGSGNRLNSPGPFTDNNNGPRCEGPGCQQTNPPPPEPEG